MRDTQRNRLAHMALALIAEAPRIHYIQRRPMVVPQLGFDHVMRILRGGGTVSMDCSEAVTALYRWAGCQDPNGARFNGTGWTGAMWAHLPHYTNPANAHLGALCIWGDQGREHVAMVIARNGSNPIMFSHGGESGPLRIDLATESSFHRGQARVFCDVSGL